MTYRKIPGVSGAAVCIRSQRGLTLLEVLVAGFIMMTVIIAFGTALFMGRGFIDKEGDRQRALAFAQQKIEELRSEVFNNIAPGEYNDNLAPNLLRIWTIEDKGTANLQLKTVSVTVSSTEEPPRFYDVALNTVLTPQ